MKSFNQRCFNHKQGIKIVLLILLFFKVFCQSCNREVIDFDDRTLLMYSKSEAPLSIEYYSNLNTDSLNSYQTRFVLDRLTNRIDSVIYDHGHFTKYNYLEDSIVALYPNDTSFIYLAENKIIATTSKEGFQLYGYNENGYLNFINNTGFYLSQFTYKSNNDLDYITHNNSVSDYYIFHDSLVYNPKILKDPFNPFNLVNGFGFYGALNMFGKSSNKLIKAIHRYQNGSIIAYTNYDWDIEGDRILNVDISKFTPFNNNTKERYIFHYDN